MKNTYKLFKIITLILLVALLVPTMLSCSRRTKLSNNNQILKNINAAIENDRNLNNGKKHANMTEALKVAEAAGFDIVKLNENKMDNEIIWDSENDIFCYYNDGDIEYIPEYPGSVSVSNNNYYKYWVIASEYKPTSKNFSVYLSETEYTTFENITSGLDVGKNENVELISYVGTGAKQNVIIRTNGGTLTIDAELDTVHHYGNAYVVTLTAVGTSSYYENGSTKLVDIKKGRMVITDNEETEVGTIYLTATSDAYDEIILATQVGSALPEIVAREHVSIPEEGEKLVVTIQTNVNEEGTNPSKTEQIYLYPEQDVKEEVSGYNVSDLGLLVVEAITNEAQQEVAEVIEDPIVVEAIKETKTQTLEEVMTQIEIKTNVNAYVSEIENALGIRFEILYNDNYAHYANNQKAYKYNAFDAEEQAYVDSFLNATENNELIFTNDINDYADAEKIQKALDYVKSVYGEKASNRVEELLEFRRPYLNWLADFEITFSGDIEVGSVAVSGYYTAFSENFANGAWIGYGVSDIDEEGESVTLAAGKALRLLDTAYNVSEKVSGKTNEDYHMNYAAICGYVREFSCGIANLSEANTGKTVTVKLYLYELDENGVETGTKYECHSMSYTLDAPAK